jgi:heptosyltransferase-3
LDNYYNFGNILSIFCQSAGLPIIDDQPAVYIPQHTVDAIDSMGLPAEYIVAHCSSNELDRDWETSKWQQLIYELIENYHVNIVEVGLQHKLYEANPNYHTDLCGKLSLLETAEIIRRSKLFIGIDSGPAQLANAVKTYGIILLGHYRSFKKYMPYSGSYGSGTNATILHEDGPPANIKVERVYQEVVKRLELIRACD